MTSDIIPIELRLTQHQGITLWARRWVEDGEEWEAFLGDDDHLFVLPTPAHLAAWVRADHAHDLADHPDWTAVRGGLLPDFTPDEEHCFHITNIPQLVAQSPDDVWRIAELADTAAILHSIGEVCGLDVVLEVLDSAPAFEAAVAGPGAFMGRKGGKLWKQLVRVVNARWHEVVAAIDAMIAEPDVSAKLLAAAQEEEAGLAPTQEHSAQAVGAQSVTEVAEQATAAAVEEQRDPDLEFWDEIGIDPIAITYQGRTGWSLRCYLGDTPTFLTESDQILLFASPAKLEDYLADESVENSLSFLDAWGEIREAIAGGDASVLAGEENTYVLDGMVSQLAAGPEEVNAHQLELVVELLEDAGDARGDAEAAASLSSASPLGNLVRAATQPDPDRQPPLPPFDDETAAFQALIDTFAATLVWRR